MAAAGMEQDGTPPLASFRWELVGLLWFAFFLNQADRQVFNVVLPLVRTDLRLSDTQMGAIGTAFMIVYALMVPVAGVVGDRLDRRGVVVFSLLVFSAGTLLTGMASGFMLLLVFRGVATGVGEAFYSPVAASLISSVHERTRARALSVHQTANYTGIVLGSLIAGTVADRFGWRWSFAAYGVAGLVWGALLLARMRHYDLQRAARGPGSALATFGEASRRILSSPLIMAQTVAFGGLVFALVGFLAWSPTLLYEKYGMSVASAGFASAFYHHLLAYGGVVGASVLTDRLVPRVPRIRLLVMAAGLLASAPCLWWIAGAGSLLRMYLAFAAFGLFRGLYDAGIYAALFDLVEDRLRASVASIVIAVAFLIGAGSPLIMGVIKADRGIQGGMVILGWVVAAAGAVLLAVTLLSKETCLPQGD